ncbi:hypothetical protein WN944_007871 [Citrus x changshan-huyou]|uniref:Uncharacterized protein n=1 Tax=Citrus x changshan-huyou TaxID=2935761 RepID=A0AAP0QUS5_9ROSI
MEAQMNERIVDGGDGVLTINKYRDEGDDEDDDDMGIPYGVFRATLARKAGPHAKSFKTRNCHANEECNATSVSTSVKIKLQLDREKKPDTPSCFLH